MPLRSALPVCAAPRRLRRRTGPARRTPPGTPGTDAAPGEPAHGGRCPMTEPGAAASPLLLEVRELRKYFRARGRGAEERLIKAVDDVSLSVSAGQTVALVGESG